MDADTIGALQLIDGSSLINLMLKVSIDLIALIIITRFIYYRLRKNRSYLFTFCIINLIIFLVCYMLSHLTLSLGFAFGIFAIFSILRYRTISVPIKEMTYLFICISLGIINAISNTNVSIFELVFANIAVIAFTFILEKAWMRNEFVKNVVYENINYVKPQNHDKLLSDLRERTGLNIHRFEIGRIDFLRDIANIKIYYYSPEISHFENCIEKDDDDD